MTREDYKEIVWSQSGLTSLVQEVNGITDAVWISRVSVLQLVDIIHNDIEQSNCSGCIHKPIEGETYPMECGTCSRFYNDKKEK